MIRSAAAAVRLVPPMSFPMLGLFLGREIQGHHPAILLFKSQDTLGRGLRKGTFSLGRMAWLHRTATYKYAQRYVAPDVLGSKTSVGPRVGKPLFRRPARPRKPLVQIANRCLAFFVVSKLEVTASGRKRHTYFVGPPVWVGPLGHLITGVEVQSTVQLADAIVAPSSWPSPEFESTTPSPQVGMVQSSRHPSVSSPLTP